jgi:hypothetical protein
MKHLVDSPPSSEEATCGEGAARVDSSSLEPWGLGRAAALGFVVERRRRATVAAAQEMAGVCHWADLHRLPTPAPGQVDAEIGCIGRETAHLLDHDDLDPARRAWGGPEGVEASLRLFGEAAYLVTEFAVAEVATALGMSESAARHYLGESLETRDRLPRLWARVMAGELEGWKARRIARLTIPLNAEAAGFVDLSLHRVAHRIGIVRIERVVEAALLRFDPDAAAERAEAAAEKRRVIIEDELDGTSRIHAVTDTPDAEAFEQTVGDIAKALGALGDPAPLEVRRSKALGILADPQYALDIQATAEATPAEDPDSGKARRRVLRSPLGPQIHLHLHHRLTEAAATGCRCTEQSAQPGDVAAPVGSVVRVEGPGGTAPIGPRSLAAVQRWLTELAPGAVIRLTPVIDVGADLAVDAHEIPTCIAAQVEHRDLVCQFPWCGRQSRHDKDHIEPYLHPDDGGPPDQTRALNLARLCRFHHRVKTHSQWRYRRERDGSLTWTSPYHLTYRVDPTGTRRLS